MKSKLLGVVVSLVLFGAMPSQAATLVDQGNNTYDPNTGLQWLDVNLTLDRAPERVEEWYLGVGKYTRAIDTRVPRN
jgi:hypothetical protein